MYYCRSGDPFKAPTYPSSLHERNRSYKPRDIIVWPLNMSIGHDNEKTQKHRAVKVGATEQASQC